MSLTSSTSRKKRVKREWVDDDDGVQSFGLFSAMLDNADLTDKSTNVTSIFRPASAGNATGGSDDDDDEMNTSLASLARKVHSSKSRHIKPTSQIQSSLFMKRGSSTTPAGRSNSKKNGAKRAKTDTTKQSRIGSFFTPKSAANQTSRKQLQKCDQIPSDEAKIQVSASVTKKSTSGIAINSNEQLPSLRIASEESQRSFKNKAKKSILKSAERVVQPSLVQLSLSNQSNISDTTTGDSKRGKECDEESTASIADRKERKLNRRMFGSYNLFNAPAIPPSVTHSRQREKSLLWRLHQRSSCNSTRNRTIDGGFHSMRSWVNTCWHESNVRLRHGTNGNNNITCLEFDSEGVLLAVGDNDGTIRIYDFDEVNARDMSSRKAVNGHKEQQLQNILPFITFNTGRTLRISSVAWDPCNGDKLAVIFANNAEARVYDLTTSSEDGPHFVRLLDRGNYGRKGNSTFVYLPDKQTKSNCCVLVGGQDCTVKLWNVPNCKKKQGRLVWAINPFNRSGITGGHITEILHLSKGSSKEISGLILVATSNASFALIDMNKCTRKSFTASANPTPQVVKVWSLMRLRGLKGQELPAAYWMGIKKCFVCSDVPTEIDCGSSENVVKKSVELVVITNGGWAVNVRFDVNKSVVSSVMAQICHRGPEIVKFDSSLRQIEDNNAENPTSLPKFPSVAGSLNKSHSLLVITQVAPTQFYLSNSDKRVLSTNCDNNRKSNPDGLMIINTKSRGDSTIPILEQSYVKHLAVHPDNQYIVICCAQSSSLNLIRLSAL